MVVEDRGLVQVEEEEISLGMVVQVDQSSTLHLEETRHSNSMTEVHQEEDIDREGAEVAIDSLEVEEEVEAYLPDE